MGALRVELRVERRKMPSRLRSLFIKLYLRRLALHPNQQAV